MGKVMFKGHQEFRPDDPEEFEINVNKPVSKHYAMLRFWSLKDCRKTYNKHLKGQQ
jgi:hypothetical protein